MGNRYFWFKPCPNCKKEMDCADMPSSLLYSEQCDFCEHTSGMEYEEKETLEGIVVDFVKTKICKCKACKTYE